jgi:HD-GYP domain-containing protein (c-di-GMP phosphodiesterase class II)
VNKGDTGMVDERDIENVENWTANTLRLEEELEATKEKLHFSRTLAERQRLLTLQKEVAQDFRRVKELHDNAYTVGLSNKNEIKRLKDEAERLRLESLDLSMDAWELETKLKTKRAEMWQLEKIIADSKNAG